MISEVLHTKWGTARVGNTGYYRIYSSIEGNNGKLLHRLIWEDFYNTEIPNGCVIHHKNGDKLNNCILNLQILPDSLHRSIHGKDQVGKVLPLEVKNKISNTLKGRKPSENTRKKIVNIHTENFINSDKSISINDEKPFETCLKMSKHQNTTGYFRVTKARNTQCVQGFTWAYKYYDENGKQQQITSVDINKLKEKILAKGLEWVDYNEVAV